MLGGGDRVIGVGAISCGVSRFGWCGSGVRVATVAACVDTGDPSGRAERSSDDGFEPGGRFLGDPFRCDWIW